VATTRAAGTAVVTVMPRDLQTEMTRWVTSTGSFVRMRFGVVSRAFGSVAMEILG
jgi:hypothetical protein